MTMPMLSHRDPCGLAPPDTPDHRLILTRGGSLGFTCVTHPTSWKSTGDRVRWPHSPVAEAVDETVDFAAANRSSRSLVMKRIGRRNLVLAAVTTLALAACDKGEAGKDQAGKDEAGKDEAAPQSKEEPQAEREPTKASPAPSAPGYTEEDRLALRKAENPACKTLEIS
jgi:hypothetical protein